MLKPLVHEHDLGDCSQVSGDDLVEPEAQSEAEPAAPTDYSGIVESIESTDVHCAQEVENLRQRFSTLASVHGVALIIGVRRFRETVSPLRSRHLGDACNMFIAHEHTIREPSESNDLPTVEDNTLAESFRSLGR